MARAMAGVMTGDPSPRARWLGVLGIVVVAGLLRLWHLELRPPHHDEGVNGWFVERMLTSGAYTYDPANYHGPTYFYLLAASRALFGFGLWQLRLPGALIGVALCLVPLLARRRLGWGAALAACALLATSPTLVYYARDAIHETLFAGLGLVVAACVLRWADGGRAAWVIAAAAALASMIATKETTILFLAVGGAWLLAEVVVESRRARRLVVLGHAVRVSWRLAVVGALALAVMAAIHVLLFTGFLQARGSIGGQLHNSIKAYLVWTKTGTGHGGHVKGGGYYLHLAVRYELVLYALAAIGAATAWRERWVRGPAVVGFGLCGAYSAIAYKMPWLPMSWLVLLALPAGRGVVALGGLARGRHAGQVARAALALASVPALIIATRVAFVRPADRREALAYVHTDADYNRWFPLIEAAARQRGRGRVIVAVDHPAQWPLAWSLSRYPRTRWYVAGTEDVIVVAASRADATEARLRSAYLRGDIMVRDASEPARIYLRRAVFDRLLSSAEKRGYVPIAPAVVQAAQLD